MPSAAKVASRLMCVGLVSLLVVTLGAGAHGAGDAAPGPLSFHPTVVDASFDGGDVKGVGDFDGDGHPDVAAGGYKELAFYLWPRWTKTVVALAGNEFTTDMQVVDMDGDGDPDIVAPDGPTGLLRWFENPRPGQDPARAPWPVHVIGNQGTWVHDVEIGDLDRDGRPDVVTRKGNAKEPGETILWLQRGADAFRPVKVKAAARGEGMTLADLDRDGRLDIVQNGYWLQAPADPETGEWVRREIAPGWPDQVGVTVADLNGDERPDVIIAPSEAHGRLAWYEGPKDAAAGPWTEHLLDDDVEGLHTFKVADVNNDGQPDVVAAEMPQTRQHRVMVYLKQGYDVAWRREVVSRGGGHNLRVADIDADGDLDIVTAASPPTPGMPHPLVVFRNELVDRATRPSLGRWTYVPVDVHRAKWGDFDAPPWLRYLGLAFGDLDGDGFLDLASGRYFYRNPGGDMTGPWERVDLGLNVDAALMLDVDDDGRLDVVAMALPRVYWLKPLDARGGRWEARVVADLPPTEHVNGQGYALVKLTAGKKPAVVLSAGDGVYALTIPKDPRREPWPKTRIAPGASEEGFAFSDVDADGRLDVVAALADGHHLAFWRNPGGAGDWAPTPIGETREWIDRVAAAQLDDDPALEIVVSEECFYEGASVYVFDPPAARGGPWERRTVVTQYTTNAMDVADFDQDGRDDVVTGEHRGSRKIAVWRNRGDGRAFEEHVVDTGKESHLGARAVDLDGDGDLDLVSIAWDTYPFLHLWRNDALRGAPARP